jgi:hypothetical protein
MDDILVKIEQIYKQLEEDRTKALDEYNQMRDEASLVDIRFRHKVREVGGQLLKLAIDASIGMAKVLEPIVKNEGLSSAMGGRRELLEMLEKLDKQPTPQLEDGTVPLDEIIEDAPEEVPEEVIAGQVEKEEV